MQRRITLLLLLLPLLLMNAAAAEDAADRDLDDVLAITRSALLGDLPVPRGADTDGSGDVSLRDSVHLLRYLCGEAVTLAEPPAEVSFEGQFSVPADATYVDFGEHQVWDWADVAPFLRQLPALTRCDMYASVIAHDQIEALAAEFPQVRFGWTMLVAHCGHNAYGDIDHVVRTDATAFSTLHYGFDTVNQHTSREFSVLRFCKGLKALDLGHNWVDDISWLAELTELRILIIAVAGVRDISPLAGLTHLQHVELFNNHITDVSPLAGCHELTDLNLCINSIRDFTPLMGLSQLKRLWIWSSHDRDNWGSIPAATYEALRRALPGCHIDNSAGDPTGGGWRYQPNGQLQPHAAVIRRIFERGVYEPFQ